MEFHFDSSSRRGSIHSETDEQDESGALRINSSSNVEISIENKEEKDDKQAENFLKQGHLLPASVTTVGPGLQPMIPKICFPDL